MSYGAPDKRVAVVELKNSAKLTSGKVSALTELVRGEVSELLGGRYTVITKENINVLVFERQAMRLITGVSGTQTLRG